MKQGLVRRMAWAAWIAAMLGCTGAFAYETPGWQGDSRVRQIPYDPDEVVRVQTQRGAGTQIVLGASEHIVRVVMGDDADAEGCGRSNSGNRTDAPVPDWKISACKGDSDIFLKPGSHAHDTNLIVHTDRHDYTFDLMVLPGMKYGADGVMYRVTFSYPEDVKAADASDSARRLIAEREKSPPLQRNLSYTMQAVPGSDDIVPSAMWDDGRFTYITIAGNRKIPSVYRLAGDDTEHVPDRHMEGNVIVVHEVAKRWVLRLGNEAVELWNDAYDLNGVPPVDGTTVPGVARVLKGSGNE